MNYLILLDRKFPYKMGETFLENEIEEISSHFDKIYIFPSDVATGEKQTRKIKSKNVETILCEKSDFSKRKFKYAIKSILKLMSAKEENFQSKLLKRKIKDAIFYVTIEEQYKKIINKLDTITFNNEDYVYIYSYWLYTNAGVAIKLSKYFKEKNINVKVFSRAHGFDIYEEKRKGGYLPARKYLLDNIDKVFTCSNNGANYLKKKYPKYKNKIETAYLGTYDRGVGLLSEDNIFRIVSCSRISKVKRVHLIIKALSLIDNDSNIKIKWTHIGGGKILNKLKKKANKKLKNIEYEFLGAIPNIEVYQYYLNNPVDLFINVSSSEGLPVSIMEAISFGIPVIATDVGGTSEIVIDNQSGYLIKEKFESDVLADKIQHVRKMKNQEYMELRTSTRKLWINKYQAKENYLEFSNSIKK